MGQTLGIVSRFPDHFAHFDVGYYEVKDVSGVWHDPVPGTIPMVSVFGDNRQAKRHPEWVQVGPNQERATRDAKFFDWDALCPSRPDVFSLGVEWVKDALAKSGQKTIRLDDVTYAREGFCQCPACLEESARRGLTADAYRSERLAEFVAAVREVAERVEMTLFPDPLPGHLERRFGIDLSRLAPYVDRFVVPIYDLHYATTYWLEVLAQGFSELLQRPFFIELYSLKVPEDAVVHAAEVASAYAEGVLLAYENQLPKLLRIRERLGSE